MFDRTKNLRLSVIKQMEIMATQFPDTISLAQGVPGFDTPECIKRRVEKALQEKVVAKYSLSPGIPELRELIEKQYRVEGDLKRDVFSNVKRLKEIGSYRGTRHAKKLPARGQRTKTNSRTVRGNMRRTMGSGRKDANQKT